MSMTIFSTNPYITSRQNNTAPALPAPNGWDSQHPSLCCPIRLTWLTYHSPHALTSQTDLQNHRTTEPFRLEKLLMTTESNHSPSMAQGHHWPMAPSASRLLNTSKDGDYNSWTQWSSTLTEFPFPVFCHSPLCLLSALISVKQQNKSCLLPIRISAKNPAALLKLCCNYSGWETLGIRLPNMRGSYKKLHEMSESEILGSWD